MDLATVEADVNVGDNVKWAGVQDGRCAPGFNGTILSVAHHDPDSFKVDWEERGSYTWERRKNLSVVDEQNEPGNDPSESAAV